MSVQDRFDRMTRSRKVRICKCALVEDRSISRRCEQEIALAHRDTELLGQMEDHLPAGLRPARFDKAQMPLGDFGLGSEGELTQRAPVAPFPQQ